MSSWRLFQRTWSRQRTARSEMREELQFHLEARIEHLMARGYTREAAREEALRRLGTSFTDAERTLGASAERKERRLNVRDRMQDLFADVRYAIRGLLRRPGFTIVAALTLAIGIGANTAIYSAVDALLLRSLPFRDPGSLVDIAQTTDNSWNAYWSHPRYEFFRNAQRSYSSLALHRVTPTTLTGVDPERVVVEEVTTEYLKTLGVQVALGTDLPAELDRAPGARKTAVIGDALWQRRFNGDPSILGKTLSLNNEPWEIVGVLPAGFRGLSGRAEAVINLSARPADGLNRGRWSFL